MANDGIPQTEMPPGDPARAEPESIPPAAAESQSSPPAPDARAHPAEASPATEGPLDLDKMEAQIRRRLGALMHRAKAVETRAKHLLKRFKPMVRTRKELERVAEEGNTRIQAIIQVPAEAWFDVVAARQLDVVTRLSGLQQWLDAAEKRWGDVTAAAPEPKARFSAARMAKSPRPDQKEGRPSP